MANTIINKCNIFKQICQLILYDGEKECPYCNGYGGFFISAHPKDRYFKIMECKMCLGEGKLDWISFINKRSKAIHAKIIKVNMKCPSSRGHKCKTMKRLWKQKKMKDSVRICQGY